MTLRSVLSNHRDAVSNPVVLFTLRLLLVVRRASAARAKPREALRYLVRGREVTNLTYEIANVDEMIAMAANVLRTEPETLALFVRELQSDRELRERLSAKLATRPNRSRQPRYGKRQVTYCIVRARKPRVVVETGTADGLGTAVVARALERNAAEGHAGRVHTLDINPDAGWLLAADQDQVSRHVGDITAILQGVLRDGVDVFIHDSLKVYDHERFELESALSHARGALVMYTDDASATGALGDLSRERGFRFGTCRESPLHHFWPGNEIGVAVAEWGPPKAV